MLNTWSEQNGFLIKSFKFNNFQEAFAFMTRVAFLAEARNHHPNWQNVYNEVNIKLRSHDEDAITHKDYELASEIDKIGV
jgi:4a-hydroxytetrahydrobiopterin dehydratase